MLEHGFHRLEADHCVYIKRYDQGKYIILLLYVDDMFIIGHDQKGKERFGQQICNEGFGSNTTDIGHEDHAWQEKKKVVVFIRKIYQEGAWHD